MPKESTIQHYTSSTTGNAPAAVDLATGELAINTADEKVFYKNHVGTVLSLSQTKDLSGAFASKSAVVTSFNGTTGAVGFTIPLATTSLTGVASFNPTHFTVATTGHVSLASAYQVTGQTIVAGNNISTTTSGNTVTINVTAAGSSNAIQFNDGGKLTGNASFTYAPSTGEFTVTIGESARSVSLLPGPECYIASNGNSNLNIISGNSGINTVRIGDVDANGNSTKIIVDDGNADVSIYADNSFGGGTVNLNAGDSIILNANTVQGNGGLTNAGWLTVGGGATFNGNVTLGKAATNTTTIYGTKIVNEGVYANGSLRTANISFANGQVQTLTGVGTGATGTTAIYFTNPPSTGAASVTMIITNGGLMTGTGMTAWGGNIKWAGGIKPVLTSSGVDVVSFVTPDAGTTIYGFVGGLGFS